jgi:hypothetical protein
MDANIISAIISSLATIIAAIITVKYGGRQDKIEKEESTQYSIFNNTYTILKRKKDNKIIAIKDGFSWWAFFFTYLWLLYNRLWDVIFSTLLAVIFIGIHFYLVDYIGGYHFLEYYVKFITWIIIYMPLILGSLGNRMITRKYVHDYLLLSPYTFQPVKSIIATTRDNAILKYIEKEVN